MTKDTFIKVVANFWEERELYKRLQDCPGADFILCWPFQEAEEKLEKAMNETKEATEFTDLFPSKATLLRLIEAVRKNDLTEVIKYAKRLYPNDDKLEKLILDVFKDDKS